MKTLIVTFCAILTFSVYNVFAAESKNKINYIFPKPETTQHFNYRTLPAFSDGISFGGSILGQHTEPFNKDHERKIRFNFLAIGGDDLKNRSIVDGNLVFWGVQNERLLEGEAIVYDPHCEALKVKASGNIGHGKATLFLTLPKIARHSCYRSTFKSSVWKFYDIKDDGGY